MTTEATAAPAAHLADSSNNDGTSTDDGDDKDDNICDGITTVASIAAANSNDKRASTATINNT